MRAFLRLQSGSHRVSPFHAAAGPTLAAHVDLHEVGVEPEHQNRRCNPDDHADVSQRQSGAQ